MQQVLTAAVGWLPRLQLLVTSCMPAAAAVPSGPCMLEQVEPLVALDAEALMLQLVPTVQYPELIDLAAACGCVPLVLTVVANAMNAQQLSTQVGDHTGFGPQCSSIT